jgi:hypothetical protein
MLKFEQLMNGSYFENTELSESQVASLFDEHATFKEIIKNVIGLDDIDLNIFGNYLYYSFFAETPDEGELDFSIVDVISMLTELNDYNIYQVVNDELKHIIADPEYFMEIPFENNIGLTDVNDFDNSELEDDYSEGEISEAKIHIMTAKTANKKRRKFFTLSKAQLLRNKPKNKIKNRMNRAKTRAYKRANAAKIKRYQISRQRLIDKGLHNVKLRRKA